MDIVQKRLELIDFKLSLSPAYVLGSLSHSAPLVLPAVFLIVGIILQSFSELSPAFWLALSIISALLAVIYLAVKKSRSNLYIIIFVTAVCSICLGAIRLSSFLQPGPNDIRSLITDQPTLAAVRGLIITEPYTGKNDNWAFAKFKFTDSGSSFYLKTTEAQTTEGWKKVTGVVPVYVKEMVQDLKAGDSVQMFCWLEKLRRAPNPGQFDFADYLAQKNIFISASVDSRQAVELLHSGSAGSFVKLKTRLRQIAAKSLLGSSYAEDQSESLLIALVLGYRANIDSTTYEAFRQTGLLHFVCLSGMNFGILVGIIWWLCTQIGLTKRLRAVVCTIVSVLFLLVIPSNAPAFRAAIICFVFCASFFFRRRPNPFNSLALSAIILLLIRPTNLFEVGWQLSFATVLGILLFTDRIHFFLYEKITGHSWFEKKPKTRAFARIIARPGPLLLNLFSVSLAAWLSSVGILVYNFYSFQYLTSIWTVFASPFIAALSILGYLKLLLGLILPTTSNILNIIIEPLADLLIRLVKLFAGVHLSEILLGRVNGLLIILYYALILFIAFVYIRRPLLKKAICLIWLAAVIFPLAAVKLHRNQSPDLVLSCLDVGHGQAVLAQLPGGKNLLFDAGSLFQSNPARRIIIPYLHFEAIDNLDAIIISHNDIDHINAIPELVTDLKIAGVYANDDSFIDRADTGAAKFLNDSLQASLFNIRSLDNLRFSSPADLKIIWPPKQASFINQLSDNDRSVVILITYAGVRILLCSDIEKFAQQRILALYPDLEADIVVVPHHGSTATTDPAFLEALKPQFLIYSSAQFKAKPYQQIPFVPSAASFFTARDGLIRIRIDRTGRITFNTTRQD